LVDARRAVWDLRASAPVEAEFPATLRNAAEHALRGSDIELTFAVTGMAQGLDHATEVALVRVLQEAIANTIKHADARTVRVELRYQRRGVRLTVADDGCGFPLASDARSYGGHWGLLGMKERAGQLYGTLEIESTVGHGTSIVLRLPYRSSAMPTTALS